MSMYIFEPSQSNVPPLQTVLNAGSVLGINNTIDCNNHDFKFYNVDFFQVQSTTFEFTNIASSYSLNYSTINNTLTAKSDKLVCDSIDFTIQSTDLNCKINLDGAYTESTAGGNLSEHLVIYINGNKRKIQLKDN